MKKLSLFIGRILYWTTWPASFIFINGSERTRLLIVCEQQILVVKTLINNNTWTLPGGGLHRNEQALDGVLREVREEVKLNFRKKDVRSLGSELYTERGVSFMCHYFVIEIPKILSPKLTIELVDSMWAVKKELTSLRLGKDVITALRLVQG